MTTKTIERWLQVSHDGTVLCEHWTEEDARNCRCYASYDRPARVVRLTGSYEVPDEPVTRRIGDFEFRGISRKTVARERYVHVCKRTGSMAVMRGETWFAEDDAAIRFLADGFSVRLVDP